MPVRRIVNRQEIVVPRHRTAAVGTTRVSRLVDVARNVAAVTGGVLLVAVLVGAGIDIARIDGTRGGYEAPYRDYRGTPIDWDAETFTTSTGMVATGHVIDVHTDCTTGMIGFEILGVVHLDYRRLSPRALAVHDPATACRERGLEPRF
ncbi:hypothetical protein [Egicoccus sp. AB-alg2]|uniref:hypothetical protein n=1 Tax=Egicoccus sp. AB-alg2 TaxID=3242693 RepID=UPI00359E7E3E